MIAAGKIDVPSIAVRTGGFSKAELREAGAGQVFDTLTDFRRRLDETVLAAPS